MNSPLTIVTEYALVSGTSLYTLVDTRVAKDRIPTTRPSFSNSQAILVIQSQALVQDSFDAPVMEDRYIFKCYGGTSNPDTAETLFRAVHDRFHKAHGDTASSGIVLSEFESGSPMVDPDMGWPLYVATFRIKTT